MDEEQPEGKFFATFERYTEFLEIQTAFLSSELVTDGSQPGARNDAVSLKVQRLTAILDEYQEQAYLLDPFLEELVAPIVERLKVHAKASISGGIDTFGSARARNLAALLYSYIKVRGYKTITRFFPHAIDDLSIALNYLVSPETPAQEQSQWPLRYVMLLWLSLICMLPFDLEQFDEPDAIGETAKKIERVAKSHLGKAGIERDGAAILLSRLYTRKDMTAKLPAFLEWYKQGIQESDESFLAIGSLRVLCEVAKSGSAELVQEHVSSLLEVVRALEDREDRMNNTLVRKLRTKLMSRVVLRLMPARTSVWRKGRVLMAEGVAETAARQEEQYINVPEDVENVLQDLFRALQDKDTVVRYSSSKGIARISERLPSEFAEQVFETVLQLFSVHSIAVASIYDMPSIAEATWHGACLACAEMARRGLVADSQLGDLIEWLSKALYFDIRKGAHSIGSSVRDAAAYVLWSLSRATSLDALRPHADTLARKLVTVSLFDREVHIRRAASAAFQEFVGRTSLFSHGIDVLRKTDFYAVGTRRKAFLIAAPEVAEHDVYRPHLIDHLLLVTLRHWDPTMRRLGAQSLRAITQLDLPNLGLSTAQRATQYLSLPDVGDVHGALLVLAELAAAHRDTGLEEARRKIFSFLSLVPLATIRSPRHELVTAAACSLVANGISSSELQLQQNSSVSDWRQIIDIGLKSRSSNVQEAAAAAMAAVSKLVDCSAVVQSTWIREGRAGSSATQQSLCRVLGVMDYNAHPHGLLLAIKCLLDCVDRSSPTVLPNVEARKNAYLSLPQILANIMPRLSEHVSPSIVVSVLNALLAGLEDYSTDERGDVGSWIRIACIKGLTAFAEMFHKNASSIPDFKAYFPASIYHRAIGGILKQGVERLDNVRQQAGEQFLRILVLPLPDVPDAEAWRICGHDLVKTLFMSELETIGWNEGGWLFPKAVQLLEIQRYRESILKGLVLSANSRTDSTQRPVSLSLTNYARTLPLLSTEPDQYDLRGLSFDLVAQAKRDLTSNHVVVPVLQTFNILLEADAFEALYSDPEGLNNCRAIFSIASRNVSRLKNVQRILMSMRIVVNLLPVAELRANCIAQLPSFLAHQFPKIRTDTAEYLYLVLQIKDLGFEIDEAEEVLLETEWSSESAAINDAAQRFVQLLLEASE